MEIYFAGSIRGGRDGVDIYNQFINFLKGYEKVLTEHIGDKTLTNTGELITDKEIYDRDVDWITKADVFIAECSNPSLGVGYEICKAEHENIMIIVLYKQSDKKLSTMINGNERVNVIQYSSIEEAFKVLGEILLNLKEGES